jgi:hypothetical protein
MLALIRTRVPGLDVVCDSKQGIPGKVGADLCMGMALDVLLEEANNVNSL